MFKQLVLTEFDSNKTFLLLWLGVSGFLFLFLGIRGTSLGSYEGLSLISFWILLVASAIVAGEQKRLRLYAQLPVTASQVFLASWLLVLCWIGLLLVSWFLFGTLFDTDFDNSRVQEQIANGIAIALIIVIIAIAIDLHAFRPAYLRWLYIGSLLLLLAGAIVQEISIGITGDENGIQVVPLSLIGDPATVSMIGLLLLALLLAVNYYVYTHSDHYIR